MVAGAASYLGTGVSYIGAKVSSATGIAGPSTGSGMSSGTMQGFGSEDMRGSDYYNPPGGGYSGYSD